MVIDVRAYSTAPANVTSASVQISTRALKQKHVQINHHIWKIAENKYFIKVISNKTHFKTFFQFTLKTCIFCDRLPITLNMQSQYGYTIFNV